MTAINHPIFNPVGRERWLRVDPTTIGHLEYEELICDSGGCRIWVTVVANGERHRFLCTAIGTPLMISGQTGEIRLRTAATPAVGEWTEVDEDGQPVFHHRPIIGVTSDRQIGKTDLLLLVASREVLFRPAPRVVMYETYSMTMAREVIRRFADDYLPESEIEKVRLGNGNYHVRLHNGSRVFFRSVACAPWRGDVDVHIVDDARPPKYFYRRGSIPALIYQSVTTGDGCPL